MGQQHARVRLGSRWMFLLCAMLACVIAHGQAGSGPQPVSPQNPEITPAASAPQGTADEESDLTAAATKARAEKARQQAKRTANSAAVDAMAAELSEESEQGPPPPVGYRYYKFKPGDYSVLVPGDAEVEGRDSYGLKLLSSEAMSTRTIVILGNPIPSEGETPLEILHNAAAQYFPGCKLLISGLGPAVNGHAAGTQGLCPLNGQIMGRAEFVLGDGYVAPIICGYPFKAEDLDPNPRQPIAKIINKYDREKNGYRACDTVLPSVRFNQHGAQLRPGTPEIAPRKAVVTNALLGASSSETGEGEPLGNFARAHRQPVATHVVTELDHAREFSVYNFTYCSKEQCFPASLELPAKARKNEQFQTAYTGLFEFDVPVGDATAVIQATTGGSTRPGIISRQEFINTKVDWWIGYVPAVYFSGAGKADVFSEELTTISSMPARLATYRTPTSFQPVITQLAAYMAPGVFVQIRCSVPEKVYSDAQAMCEHVVQSLQVPQAKKEKEEPSENPGDDDP